LQKSLIECLATGFYVGRLKPGPGTWGTLVGVLLFLLMGNLPAYFYMGATLLLIGVAIWVSQVYELTTGRHDPKEVVIDEVVGFLVAMTLLPMTWQAVLAGFVLFRFFDILKPFPISWLDKRVQGGIGTVADDLAAGIITNIILQWVYVNTNWLGERLYESSAAGL
jgi:phosphatidylglycerophosphatase A